MPDVNSAIYKIRIETNVRIPLSDGVRLSANLYMPDEEGLFPGLVSYYPYHKDDMIGTIFDYSMRFFAEHGYAALLVDFRGTGGSEGLYWEPLDIGEHKDGAEIVEWIANQPWCDGNVGMWGGSYGGITSLQTATQEPPHLKAIVPMVACSDTYYDLAYPGGCPNCMGVYGMWAAYMLAMNLMPPTNPDAEGEWYRIWTERLGKQVPLAFHWQDHPTYDEYWRSKAIDVTKIKVPTFLMGSWRDLFPEATLQIYQKLTAPKKLLMGPWSHIPPDLSVNPDPMDHYQDMLAWWDYWLKGKKNAVMDEPPLMIFVQNSNTWKYETEWPIARRNIRTFFLSKEKKLQDTPQPDEVSHSYKGIPTMGTLAGLWDPMSLGIGYPLDQGGDDLLSLSYTSEPLMEDTEITGSSEVVLALGIETEEDVHLVAKLNDIGPEGSSSHITGGWLKVNNSQPKVNEYHMVLWATSYRVPAGHRLRLSVSCSDFPRIFPSRTNPDLRVVFGGIHMSCLRIPVVAERGESLRSPKIARPEPEINRVPRLIDASPKWKIEQDLVAGTLSVTTGAKEYIALAAGGRLQVDHTGRAYVSASRPDGAKVLAETAIDIDMPTGERINVETRSSVSLGRVLLNGKVTIDGRLLFEKEWAK